MAINTHPGPSDPAARGAYTPSRVFRIEKYAGEYDVIITGSVLGVIRHLLDEKNISFTGLGSVKLNGFDEDAFLYKLNFPVKGERASSSLLGSKMEALETDTRVIPVFGDLYPAMNMEDNFINLEIKAGDQEKGPDTPGPGKYAPSPGMDRDGDEGEERPGIDLRWKREREREWPGYVDVKTLYNIHHHGIILGLPGSGKTTILKYFAFREFKENRKIQEEDKKRVVLFIPCRHIMSYHDWACEMGAREPPGTTCTTSSWFLSWYACGSRSKKNISTKTCGYSSRKRNRRKF